MPRSYDSRQFPAGPFVEPRVTPTHRGIKRLGAIGEIVPGDDIEVARAIARIRHPRQRVPPIVHKIKLTPDPYYAFANPALGIPFIHPVEEDCAGYQLYAAELACTVVGSTATKLQITNVHDDVTLADTEMLATQLQIDANEFHSKDSSVQYEIDLTKNVVEWGDRLELELTQVGPGVRGLTITLYFCPS